MSGSKRNSVNSLLYHIFHTSPFSRDPLIFLSNFLSSVLNNPFSICVQHQAEACGNTVFCVVLWSKVINPHMQIKFKQCLLVCCHFVQNCLCSGLLFKHTEVKFSPCILRRHVRGSRDLVPPICNFGTRQWRVVSLKLWPFCTL
jgi:hypothetical protein